MMTNSNLSQSHQTNKPSYRVHARFIAFVFLMLLLHLDDERFYIVANAAPTQTSHDWGRCERRAEGTACDDVMDVDFVWVYGSLTQAEQVQAIRPGLNIVRNATENEPDNACRRRWKQRLCETALPPCYIDNEAGQEAPQRLCTSECEEIWSTCSRVFKQLKNSGDNTSQPVDCDAIIGAEEASYQYFSRNYLKQWEGEPVFVSFEPGENPLQVKDPDTNTKFSYPCWGSRDESDDYSSDSYEFFWEDEYLDNEDFQKLCEAKGGTYASQGSGSSNDSDPTCVFTSRQSCERNGGTWDAVDQNSDGQITFECFLPMIESSYSSAETTHWPTPTATFGDATEEITSGQWALPLDIKLEAGSGATILLSHKADVSSSCTTTCAAAPSLANYDQGLVKLVPSGKWLSITRPGRHILRLRAIGQGKGPSPELVLDFGVVKEEVLPPTDSNLVYLRTRIILLGATEETFDVYLFRVAVMQALNSDLQTEFTIANVQVLEVDATSADNGAWGVEIDFEVRMTSALQPLVASRLSDILFLYPLAQQMFAAGLVNATDSCSAVSYVQIDTSSFTTLRGLTTSSNLNLIIGLSCSLVVVCIAVGIAIRIKIKRLHAQEKYLHRQQADVDRKAASLEAREIELADKVKHIEEQEKELLSEKERLGREKEALEEEAEEARQQIDEVEKEELRELDPEAASALESEEVLLEEELIKNVKSDLERLREQYTGKLPEEDLCRNLEQLKAIAKTVALLQRIRVRSGEIVGSSDIALLKSFEKRFSNVADREEFSHMITQLQKKGALRETLDDPREEIKGEYHAALASMHSNLVDRREEHRNKFAERRKQRIAMVIDDAKQESAVGTTSPLVEEALTKLECDFEEEREKMRAEAPSQEEYETALARLEAKKQENRDAALKNLDQRRAKIRDRLHQTEEKANRERAAAEARQQEIASKVTNVFKKISSVEHKVTRLKEEHQSAQEQLKQELDAQKERQRKKIEARKRKRGTKKVSPDE